MRLINYVVSGLMPRMSKSRHKAARYRSLAYLFIWLPASQAFADDSIHVHMLSGSAEYKSEESLKGWAAHLERDYGIRSTFSLGTDRSTTVDGLEQMKQADALVIFCRRWELEGEQAVMVRRAIESGIPILGIRTASHAFEFYKEFDKAILGGDYQGHTPEAESVQAVPCSENTDHPVLDGLTGWEHSGKIYYNPGIAADVTALLSAHSDNIDAPLAWIRTIGDQRIFYTSMGYPEDFRNPKFIRMLDNALFWIVDRAPVHK